MVIVSLISQTGRVERIVADNTIIRQFLINNNVNPESGMTSVSGTTLSTGELDKTFADFGISDHCFVANVAKPNGANK